MPKDMSARTTKRTMMMMAMVSFFFMVAAQGAAHRRVDRERGRGKVMTVLLVGCPKTWYEGIRNVWVVEKSEPSKTDGVSLCSMPNGRIADGDQMLIAKAEVERYSTSLP